MVKHIENNHSIFANAKVRINVGLTIGIVAIIKV